MDENTKKIAQAVYDEAATKKQYGVGPVQFHTHNGIDSPRVANFRLIITGVVTTDGSGNATITDNRITASPNSVIVITPQNHGANATFSAICNNGSATITSTGLLYQSCPFNYVIIV